jgi:FkbH-like protein
MAQDQDATPVPTAWSSLDALAWQETVFAEEVRRRALRSLVPGWPCRVLHVHVVRNQPFETIVPAMQTFLAFSGLRAELTISAYDDSLSDPCAEMAPATDVVAVWLQFEHYRRQGNEDLAQWLIERLLQIRRSTSVPILLANWASTSPEAVVFNKTLEVALGAVPGARICDQAAIAAALGDEYEDPRLEIVAGSSLSERGAMETARNWGLRWFPAIALSPLKAVVVDLDNTIWGGVLSEDGAEHLVVSEDHHRLHSALQDLQGQGIFLGLASKNDRDEVEGAFDQLPLGLSLSDFSASAVGWGSKARSLEEIARQLHIGTDALLFLDDNPGELAEVAAQVPGVRLALARDPAHSARTITSYPGIDPWPGADAGRRASDLRAADERQHHLAQAVSASAQDTRAYLAALGTRLTVHVDDSVTVGRLAELSARTNQFNTGLLRLGEADVAGFVADSDRCAAALDLEDRFSDSGTVAAVFARAGMREELVVDEIVVSCRALGRGLEEAIVAVLLRAVHGALGGHTLRVRLCRGPRNEPAFATLAGVFGIPALEGELIWPWSEAAIEAATSSFPADVMHA